jgi:hypothetical protein
MATPKNFPARYCRRVGRRGKDGEGEGEVEQEVVALRMGLSRSLLVSLICSLHVIHVHL